MQLQLNKGKELDAVPITERAFLCDDHALMDAYEEEEYVEESSATAARDGMEAGVLTTTRAAIRKFQSSHCRREGEDSICHAPDNHFSSSDTPILTLIKMTSSWSSAECQIGPLDIITTEKFMASVRKKSQDSSSNHGHPSSSTHPQLHNERLGGKRKSRVTKLNVVGVFLWIICGTLAR